MKIACAFTLQDMVSRERVGERGDVDGFSREFVDGIYKWAQVRRFSHTKSVARNSNWSPRNRAREK